MDQTAELEDVIRLQMDEIDRLRAENQRLIDWIMGNEPDALLALQKVYSDPKTTEPNVIKAAIGALAYERSKPAQVVITADWTERTRSARLAQLELDKAEWARQEAQPQLDLPPTILAHDDEGEDHPAA
jgi:hypothetical protein